MPDFSPSGITDLPPLTWDAKGIRGDGRTIGWLREAIQEGDRINQNDPMYPLMDAGMRYVVNDQRTAGPNQPAYAHPNLRVNECRAAMQAHVSALTDFKPLFAYKALNPAAVLPADVLNKLTLASWINNSYDQALGDCVKYALAAGTGDLVLEWDPHFGYGGDMRMLPRDARDTLPIRPATHDRSVQAWEGCIIREAHTVNTLRAKFPTFADLFVPTTDSVLATFMGRFRSFAARVISPAADTLSGLNRPAVAGKANSGDVIFYRTYLTDRSRNLTTKPIPMGVPGAAWTYVVEPGARLYPYKRLILHTPDAIIYDGPGPYWHGQYPIHRMKLWEVPWNFLGQGLFADLIPIQDALNSSLQDLKLGIDQWLNPAVTFNRLAVSENTMRLYDPRRPGAKIKLHDAGMKEGFKREEGPAPPVLALAIQLFGLLDQKFSHLSGTPNLQELMQLRQLPGAETIQRMWESLTPELRQEGRAIEIFLRGVAEQQKSLRFQYESQHKRVLMLGDAAQTLEDFDFDPEQLVPSMRPGMPKYDPAFDASLPRDVRAQAFARQIAFVMAPNSILSLNATEGKLMKLQLSRAGMYDFWSLMDALEIPNVGAPPPIPLPPLDPEKAHLEFQQAQQTVQLLLGQGMQGMVEGVPPAQLIPPDAQAQLQAAQKILAKYVPDPISGQLLELRTPLTVTERLIAQQQLGIGMTESPAGRKASGQAPPQMEQKSDGRTTVSESRHEKGPGSE